MSWQLVVDDSFLHANTSAGSAGSTTGVPTSPATGAADGWTDRQGGVYSITSDTLIAVPGGTSFATNDLYRATSGELGNPDQRILLDTQPPNTYSGHDHYAAKLRRAD